MILGDFVNGKNTASVAHREAMTPWAECDRTSPVSAVNRMKNFAVNVFGALVLQRAAGEAKGNR